MGKSCSDSDCFIVDAINQKNVSMNANQALSTVAAIVQDLEELQVAAVEVKEEIENNECC